MNQRTISPAVALLARVEKNCQPSGPLMPEIAVRYRVSSGEVTRTHLPLPSLEQGEIADTRTIGTDGGGMTVCPTCSMYLPAHSYSLVKTSARPGDTTHTTASCRSSANGQQSAEETRTPWNN